MDWALQSERTLTRPTAGPIFDFHPKVVKGCRIANDSLLHEMSLFGRHMVLVVNVFVGLGCHHQTGGFQLLVFDRHESSFRKSSVKP
jgi:hypothetical protein